MTVWDRIPTWQGLSVFSRRREIDIQRNAKYSLSFYIILWWFSFWSLSSAKIGYLCNERTMAGRSSTNTKCKEQLISRVMQNPAFLSLSFCDDFSSEACHQQELVISARKEQIARRSSTDTKCKKAIDILSNEKSSLFPLSLCNDFSSKAYHLQELIILAIKEHWPGRLALIQNAKSHCEFYEWTVFKLALINLAW